MHDDDQPDWIEWLGLRKFPNFRKSRALGGLIGVIGTITAVVFLGLVIVETFQALLGIGLEVDTTQHEAIRNLGLALAAIIGLPFLVWRSIVAQKQVDVAEQGQITDRINDAVKGLGTEKTVKRQRRDANGEALYVLDADGTPDETQPIWDDITEPNLEVRIGAIYALERIAQDSDRDHIQIMEILCAYIRQNAPASEAQETIIKKWWRENRHKSEEKRSAFPNQKQISCEIKKLNPPRPDISVALDVLRRRSPAQISIERRNLQTRSAKAYQLDLRSTNMQRADLENAEFENARLEGSHLDGAILTGSRLNGANMKGTWLVDCKLDHADLEGVDLTKANLTNAILRGSNLCQSKLVNTNLPYAVLANAQVDNAALIQANLRFARLNGANLSDASLVGSDLGGVYFGNAILDRALLIGAKIDNKTSIGVASVKSTAVRSINFAHSDITQYQANSAFGDHTTRLPPKIEPPEWKSQKFDNDGAFYEAWRAHKAAHNIP